VDLPDTCFLNKSLDVLNLDSATGHDDGTSSRNRNEISQGCGSFKGSLHTSRGKNPVGTSFDDISNDW